MCVAAAPVIEPSSRRTGHAAQYMRCLRHERCLRQDAMARRCCKTRVAAASRGLDKMITHGLVVVVTVGSGIVAGVLLAETNITEPAPPAKAPAPVAPARKPRRPHAGHDTAPTRLIFAA